MFVCALNVQTSLLYLYYIQYRVYAWHYEKALKIGEYYANHVQCVNSYLPPRSFSKVNFLNICVSPGLTLSQTLQF